MRRARVGLREGGRVLVAIDGPDAAGKTTLARGIAERLKRPALSASVDRWHNPREVRLRRGTDFAEGYYLDSFDYDALVRECLDPFASGAAYVRTAIFDHRTNGGGEMQQKVAPDAILLFDGVFLPRPELQARWDLRVYLHVPESVTLARAANRDRKLLGTSVTAGGRGDGVDLHLPGGRGRRCSRTRLTSPRPTATL